MKSPLVEVVRRRSPRPVAPPSAPLPEPVLSALDAIVRDMRDVPRDCIVDRAELLHWLRRMAGRVEGIGRMRVPAAAPVLARLSGSSAMSLPRPATPRDLAEAVFGNTSKLTTKPVERRTITNRKGRAVKVETRRARAAWQLEFGL